MDGLLYEEESFLIRGAVYEVYKEVGCGFLEAVYQECLEKELVEEKIPFVAQAELKLHYKGQALRQSYKPDFVCFEKIIVEVKAAKILTPEHMAQVLNYLKAANLRLGLLVNFGSHPKAQIERLVL